MIYLDSDHHSSTTEAHVPTTPSPGLRLNSSITCQCYITCDAAVRIAYKGKLIRFPTHTPCLSNGTLDAHAMLAMTGITRETKIVSPVDLAGPYRAVNATPYTVVMVLPYQIMDKSKYGMVGLYNYPNSVMDTTNY